MVIKENNHDYQNFWSNNIPNYNVRPPWYLFLLPTGTNFVPVSTPPTYIFPATSKLLLDVAAVGLARAVRKLIMDIGVSPPTDEHGDGFVP